MLVSGTAAVDKDGQLVGRDDPHRQAVQCLENIRVALEKLGAGFEHVVRTRIYVTDISQWEQIGRAHGEAFGSVQPATAMVEVSGLIDPEMLVEIEAEAVVTSDSDDV